MRKIALHRLIFLTIVVMFASWGIVRAQGPQTPTVTPTGPQPGSDSIGDPYFPQLGNGGYLATHYLIDLSVDLTSDTLSGTVTIDAKATQDLSAFDLDFTGFEISKVTLNGSDVPYNRTDHKLIILPAQPLANGDKFSLAVTYSGTPTPTHTEGSPTLGWVEYTYKTPTETKNGVYVASEPAAASSWYPVNDHPLDKASYTLRITVAKPYVVAANGLLQNTIDNGDTQTFVWDTKYPVASYLVTVEIADFKIVTATGPNNLPIRNYFPSDYSAKEEQAFSREPEMIALFSKDFGPYPFEAYGSVVANADFGFALETQTLSLFARPGNLSLLSGYTSEEAVAHELTHQWFGDSVSLKKWQDIWLNEGFATYGQWLWLDYAQGGTLDSIIREAYAAVKNGGPWAYIPPGDASADNLFSAGVYTRGGLTLHALRVKVGDTTFFRILQTYYQRFKYANADTNDFIGVAQEISGQDLKDFFQNWLYTDALPAIPEMGLN